MPKSRPKKVGSKVPGRGKIKRIRRISLDGEYINVGVVSKAGPRGGHTISGPVHKKRKSKKKK